MFDRVTADDDEAEEEDFVGAWVGEGVSKEEEFHGKCLHLESVQLLKYNLTSARCIGSKIVIFRETVAQFKLSLDKFMVMNPYIVFSKQNFLETAPSTNIRNNNNSKKRKSQI